MPTYTARQLAEKVDRDWTRLTGLPDSDKHEEGHWPAEVLDLVEESGVDLVEFQDAWTELQEDHG